MLKILGGHLRSRQLKTPKNGDVTRPWTGRARESVFNQLRGHIQGGNVLDLFAGVGTMGLEAVSRGAEHVVMVEGCDSSDKCSEISQTVNNSHLFEDEEVTPQPPEDDDSGLLPAAGLPIVLVAVVAALMYGRRRG